MAFLRQSHPLNLLNIWFVLGFAAVFVLPSKQYLPPSEQLRWDLGCYGRMWLGLGKPLCAGDGQLQLNHPERCVVRVKGTRSPQRVWDPTIVLQSSFLRPLLFT
jgi:hypothetical protein